ncbi:MAG: type II secretion system GspH family protein [Candidatus Gastranaerophilales bacterium]|nr:type II secretion system GspH family protein [Candidatus Gastranaerophilales bacterium]
MKHNKKQYAFSLAEVLITLVIIGLISAITVLALIQNMNDNHYKSACKKNFSVFSNAINLAYGYNYDDFSKWDYTHSLSFTTEVAEKLYDYLNVQKICGHKSGCFTDTIYSKDGSVYEENYITKQAERYSFVLNDGVSVVLDVWNDSNAQNYLGFNEDTLFGGSANLSIIVDVNGLKKPNRTGKDIFLFLLTPKGLLPAGIDNNSKNCDKTQNYQYGFGCTYKIMYGK